MRIIRWFTGEATKSHRIYFYHFTNAALDCLPQRVFCLFDLSPLCVFKCFLKLPASEDVKSHWLHLFGVSPMCFFICVLKLLV